MENIIDYFNTKTGLFIFKLFFASLLAGLLGLERERKGQAAGLRTHMVLCIGSLLAMQVSIFLSFKFPNITIDRIPGQVITGIGFLGAGAIIRFGITVRGLTTAAGLWTSAIIGLAIGAGYYAIGASTAIAVFIVTSILDMVEKKLKHIKHTALITIFAEEDLNLSEILSLFTNYETSIYEITKENKTTKVSIRIINYSPFDFNNIIEKTKNLKGLKNITIIPETI